MTHLRQSVVGSYGGHLCCHSCHYQKTFDASKKNSLARYRGVRSLSSRTSRRHFCRASVTDKPVHAPSASIEYGQVTITFRVYKCCEFGSGVCVVGNLPGLGQWDAEQSLSLEWNDGHVWTGHVHVPLDRLLSVSPGVEYKYVVRSHEAMGGVEWMPGENLHIPQVEYGTTALTVHDTWGIGYREIQVERLAEERMQEMIRQEERTTRKALDGMVTNAIRELSETATYCERILNSTDDIACDIVLDADRELAACSNRATQLLRANNALFYLDSV